ncbi:MAG: HAD-IC family P-type ATPase [Burkholderiaceae bacterium]|nr:HAD-IC family P-type ATPase [Burkholderiaceae bacterium]
MPSELIRKAKVSSAPVDEAVGQAAAADACDHCGDSLAGLRVVQRQIGATLRPYCCNGCAFIAEQLFLAQAGARDREALSSALAPGDPGHAPATAATTTAQARIDVHGMVCAACAMLIEHQLRRLPGVDRAHVDFTTRRAFVSYDDKLLSRDELLREIRRAGYETGTVARDERRAGRVELLRVLLAWLMMMQVMMLAVPLYFAAPGDVAPDIEQLMRIASLILTLPVVLFSAQPLYRAAWSQLRIGRIGMDVPVVLGIGAAFVASALATVTSRGQVYFDSVTMFVALVLGTRWLLARGLAAAREHIETARRQSQLAAQRLVAFPSSLATESVGADSLRVGDRVLVPPGETVPADGVVVHGRSSCSQAWLTGESTPIEKTAGAPVLAGSVNLDQPMVVEVTRRGEATSLAALQRLVDEAGRERPRVVELANRVAGHFLWAVLGITLLTLVGWWLVDPAQALPNAIAVLVATCPCALSLAAPATFSAAQSALAQRRVLLARTAALESLAEVDLLACDKTGTLTTGDPALLRQLLLREADPERLLAVAAALETMSTHPYARALTQAARTLPITLPPVRHRGHRGRTAVPAWQGRLRVAREAVVAARRVGGGGEPGRPGCRQLRGAGRRGRDARDLRVWRAHARGCAGAGRCGRRTRRRSRAAVGRRWSMRPPDVASKSCCCRVTGANRYRPWRRRSASSAHWRTRRPTASAAGWPASRRPDIAWRCSAMA